MRVWPPLALAVIIATTAEAQSRGRSTSSGVYSATQANRGKNVYAGYCRSCHTAESHTGPIFIATWKNKSLAELFGFIQERMPKNEPASLSDGEYVDVMSYLLKMNGMPAGKSELPADPTTLSRIRIQFPKGTAREK